jgi:type III secretion protein V
VVDASGLTEVLRRLLEEGISIRNLKGILDALARSPESHRDPLSLAEHVRAELRRPLTYELTGGAPEITVVVLDTHIEDAVRSAVSRTTAGAFLTLAPAAAREIAAAVRRAFDGSKDIDDRGRVVLTRPDIRRFVWKLLETELPDVRVVSHAELLPELVVKTRARATIAGA